MEMVGKEFESRVQEYANVWLPARCIVEDALKQRFDVGWRLSQVEGSLKSLWCMRNISSCFIKECGECVD